MKLKKNWLIYIGFFVVLLAVFYFFLFRMIDSSASKLAVINDDVPNFSFISQDSTIITQKEIEGKVYVSEFFFTTCGAICPRMNANMRRVYDAFKNDSDFVILSHTCMPETDSVPRMKLYEQKMLLGTLQRAVDGVWLIDNSDSTARTQASPNKNWFFLTGSKKDLYKMARVGYKIDNNQSDTSRKIADQFIHSQFFALVDKQRRVRGIYDGTKAAEVDQMMLDIIDLQKEKTNKRNFLNNMGNTPQ